jgi:hypothetical protein
VMLLSKTIFQKRIADGAREGYVNDPISVDVPDLPHLRTGILSRQSGGDEPILLCHPDTSSSSFFK